jgi:hypothetical protein
MRNKIIGLLLGLLFCGVAVPANAAISKQTIKKVTNLVKTSCDKLGNMIWKNKGAIAVGTVATVAVTAPEEVVQGATTVVTGTPTNTESIKQPVARSFIGTVLFHLCMIVLLISGIRYMMHCIGLWKIVPLVLFALLLCSGITEASVLGGQTVPMTEALSSLTPWLEIINFILLIVTLFV